jgi:hypothetical protein
MGKMTAAGAAVRILESEGAAIAGIAERKLAEEALHESEQRLQDIIDKTTSMFSLKTWNFATCW